MTPEKKIQTKIINYLKEKENLVYERRQAGGYSYRAGSPDVWFVYRGMHCEVEVKAVGGFPSPLQISAEQRYKKAGALYWRGCDFEEFRKWFEENFKEGD